MRTSPADRAQFRTPLAEPRKVETRMRQLFCVSLLSLVASFAMLLVAATQANAGDEELQGSWKVVSFFRDGAGVPGNGAYVGIIIHGDKIVFDNLTIEYDTLTYRTDRHKSPMHLDVFDEEGKKLTETGIFEVKQGVFRLCQGSPRPTAFQTEKDDGRRLFVLKRRDREIEDGRRTLRVRRAASRSPAATNWATRWRDGFIKPFGLCMPPSQIKIIPTSYRSVMALLKSESLRDVEEEIAARLNMPILRDYMTQSVNLIQGTISVSGLSAGQIETLLREYRTRIIAFGIRFNQDKHATKEAEEYPEGEEPGEEDFPRNEKVLGFGTGFGITYAIYCNFLSNRSAAELREYLKNRRIPYHAKFAKKLRRVFDETDFGEG